MREKTTFFTLLLWSFAGTILLSQNVTTPVPKVNPAPQLTVEFSKKGGYFDHAIVVELQATPGADIFYTTDGNEPSGSAALRYKKPILVQETMVIRAVAKAGKKKSKSEAQLYLIEEPATQFPTVSVAIPPGVLFDPVYGLFVKGQEPEDGTLANYNANYWSRTETPAHIQFIESDGKTVFNSRVGFRLFGGMSRLFSQKSFAIVTRDKYGEKSVKHEVFGKKGLKKFKYLVFRNSGSDFGRSHFRDPLMTDLVDEWDLEKQDYRPCHVYLNGRYWGIYNIREKINAHYLQSHFDVDKDSVDVLEHYYTLKHGSKKHYVAMLKYLLDNSMSDPGRFTEITRRMDVDNFMNYQIAQIYFDNRDAGGNIRYWRPRRADARWRWILYDTDWGYGLYDANSYKKNSLDFFTDPKGPSWPNPAWSTFILRKLLENKEFEHGFVNRFCDHLNSSFSADRALAKVDSFYRMLKPEIPRHQERWRLKMPAWEKEVDILRTFARERPNYLFQYLQEKFELGEMVEVQLEAGVGGKIVLNEHLEICGDKFSGNYFEKMPIWLKAQPNFGYRFLRWEGVTVDDDTREFSLRLTDNSYRIRAVFEKYEHVLAGKIVLNEVSCNNRASGDWIELYNFSKEPVRLKNWIFTDSKNEFRFPDVTLAAQEYLVVCQDSAKFLKAHPQAYNVIGGLGFGLNKRHETLGLFTQNNAFIDSLTYEVTPTDSAFTLNLLLPWLDNSDLENWEIRPGSGTPSAANPYFVESSIRRRQELWTQIGVATAVILLSVLLLFFRRRGVV